MSYIARKAFETGSQVNLLHMIIETEVGRARFYILKDDYIQADIQCDFVGHLLESYEEAIKTHIQYRDQVIKMKKSREDYFKANDEEWQEKHAS